MKKELKVVGIIKMNEGSIIEKEISSLIDDIKENGKNDKNRNEFEILCGYIRVLFRINNFVAFKKEDDGVSVIIFDREFDNNMCDLTFEDGKYYIYYHTVENKPTKRRVELIEVRILPLYSDLDFKVRGLLSASHGTNSQHKINILYDKYKAVCEEIKKLYNIENVIMLKEMNGHACVMTFDFKAESGKLFKITYDKYEECYYAEEV